MTDLSAAFEAERPRLTRVAYGVLGSVAEAEDVVQDAWLRLQGVQDPDAAIRDLPAWLTTVVSRLALDTLRSARVRREAYVGPWLPEPIVREPGPGPEDRVTLDETVSMALMVVLERLSPPERVAFVLHDLFGVPFGEVAQAVGRSPEAVRQLASRARRRVREGRSRVPPTRGEQDAVIAAFAAACAGEDLEALLELLDPEVVWRSDGGGQVPAARVPHHGAARVARGMLALSRRRPPRGGYVAEVNGAPGFVLRDGDGLVTVIAFTIDAGRITAIDTIRNPTKLARVPPPP